LNLYLVRHPRPDGVQGVCYGRQDVRIAADALAHSLASVRAHLDTRTLAQADFFSSPATRCVQLASALAAPREPLLADALLEMNFGSWEGLKWDDVPRDQLDAWAEDVWAYRPGGAESAAMVAQRWLHWLGRLAGSGIDTAVVVTHAGVIRVAKRCCGALSAATFAMAEIPYGSVHRIEMTAARVPA